MRRNIGTMLGTFAAAAVVATLVLATPRGGPQDARAADDSDAGARIEQVDVGAPIASASGPSPAGGTVTIDLLSLRQRGDLAILWVAYTYEGDAVDADEDISPFAMGQNRSPAPELIDLQQLTRHGVVSAGQRSLQSDPVLNSAVPGEPVQMYYAFAMPPEGTDAVDIRIWDFVPAFEAVPLERGS